MAVVASVDKHRQSVTRSELTLHCIANIIFRPCQVAVNTKDTAAARAMNRMGSILNLTLVTVGAKGAGVFNCACPLSMNLVAGGAGHLRLGVRAGRPLCQSAGVTGSTQLCRRGNHHILRRVIFTVRTMTRLAGHACQHELAGGTVVSGRVAREAFSRFPSTTT